MSIPTSICVFCGSRPGNDPAYMSDAKTIGSAIAQEGWRVVYGAGDIGIMGEVAQSAQAAGGHVFGVIPQHLVDVEKGKANADTYVITENMHERKKVMFTNSDGILILPGGAGTLDELFEVLTWRQLGLHDRPIVLLNTKGYWDGWVALMNGIVERGFADASILDFVTVVNTPDQAMGALRARLS